VIFHQGYVQLRRLRALGDPGGFWLIGAIVGLVGMLGHGIVDTVWFRPEVNTLWWLNVAIIASFYTYQQKLAAADDPAIED
jgi:putative inorganic carbon (HCO3(-)) transporter